MKREKQSEDFDLDCVLHALANPWRRRMVELLSRHPYRTGGLQVALLPAHLSRFAVMQHLKVLEQAGLVVSGRFGRARSNQLNPLPLQKLARWAAQFEGLRPPPLLRFKADSLIFTVRNRKRRKEQGS